jgi:hypothetical protein
MGNKSVISKHTATCNFAAAVLVLHITNPIPKFDADAAQGVE